MQQFLTIKKKKELLESTFRLNKFSFVLTTWLLFFEKHHIGSDFTTTLFSCTEGKSMGSQKPKKPIQNFYQKSKIHVQATN
jgi:hypothetical protein